MANGNGELEKLQREKARLQAEQEVRDDMAKRTREKKELRKEVSRLKHPKRTKVLRFIGRTARTGGRLAAAGTRKAVAVAEKSTRPKGRVVRRRVVRRRKPVRRRVVRRRTNVQRARPTGIGDLLFG